MKSNEHSSAPEIFERALKIKSLDERRGYLNGACGANAALREKIEALLASHADDSFLEDPAIVAPETIDCAPLTEGPGTAIGRYKLLQKIGEGGMGVVFMAEQTEPVRRKVALKIIKLGMDTKSVVARFEAERQALALMDHPNIAKVLDAGSTDTGRPYFVMELVKGVPIHHYCDKNQLPTKERLNLFTQVCQSIQHAHQKGVIHRDIKPSNILVTLHDGKPVPKVIDFGIAKATNQRLTEKTLFTNFAQMIGTPAYMSPEQAEMSGLDVDTRTDVYSLGVLLYELLTGTTPFPEKELLSKGYGEMQRIIAEQEPDRPSLRMSTLVGEQQTIVAKSRAGDLPLLTRQLTGDLDWIVMKTLEKDRTRRYETANSLAEDIHRHLNNEPVLAAKPTLRYQLAKLYHRHRPAVAAAAGITLAMLIGTVAATAQALRANHARDEAEHARSAAELAEKGERELRQIAQQERTRAIDLAEQQRLNAYVGDMRSVDNLVKNNDYQSAREILLKHRPTDLENETDLRGFEWRYLWEASTDRSVASADVGPLVTVPKGRRPGFKWTLTNRGLALSNDQRRLVVRTGSDILKVLNSETLSVLQTIKMEGDHCYRAMFSPDDSRLFIFVKTERAQGSSPEDGRKGWRMTLHIYETDTWTVAGRIENAYPPLFLNTSGHPVFMSYDWDKEFGMPDSIVYAHASHQGQYGTLSWSEKNGYHAVPSCAPLPLGMSPNIPHTLPAGCALVQSGSRRNGSGKTWTLWDIQNPDAPRAIQEFKFENTTSGETVSPDGKFFAVHSYRYPGTGRDLRTRLFKIESGREIPLEQALPGFADYVRVLAFTPDASRLIAGGSDRRLHVWNTASGHHVGTIEGQPEELVDLAVTNQRAICLFRNGELKSWPLKAAEKSQVSSEEIPVWDMAARKANAEKPLGPNMLDWLTPQYMTLMSTGKLHWHIPSVLTWDEEARRRYWGVKISLKGRLMQVVESDSDEFSSSNTFAPNPQTFRFFDLQDGGKLVAEWTLDAPIIRYPAFVNDRQAVCITKAGLEVWDPLAGERKRIETELDDILTDPYLILPSLRGNPRLANFAVHDRLGLYRVNPEGSTEGVLWSASRKQALATFNYGHGVPNWDTSWDGKLATLAGENHAIQVIDLESMTKKFSLRGHTDENTVTFTRDGRSILTKDRTGARIWSLWNGQQMLHIPDRELSDGYVPKVYFTNNDQDIYLFPMRLGRPVTVRMTNLRSLEEIDAEIAQRP